MWSQARRLASLKQQTAQLRVVVQQDEAAAHEAVLKSQICDELHRSTVLPSRTYQAALRQFAELQIRQSQLPQPSTAEMPIFRAIPLVSDDQHARHGVRLQIPASGKYALRVAVFPAVMFRDPKLPDLSANDANEVLTQTPFGLKLPVIIPLLAGEHVLESEWSVDGPGTFAMSLDEQEQLRIVYDKELSGRQKYGALGIWSEDGWLRPESDFVTIRGVAPMEHSNDNYCEFMLRCDLLRVSQ